MEQIKSPVQRIEEKEDSLEKNLIWMILIILPFLIAGSVFLYGSINYGIIKDNSVGYGGLNCFFREYCGEDFVWNIMTYNVARSSYYNSGSIFVGQSFCKDKFWNDVQLEYEEDLEIYNRLEKRNLTGEEACQILDNPTNCNECWENYGSNEKGWNLFRKTNRFAGIALIAGIFLIPFFISLKFIFHDLKNEEALPLITNLSFIVAYILIIFTFFIAPYFKIHLPFYIGNILFYLMWVCAHVWPTLMTVDLIYKMKRRGWNKILYVVPIIFGLIVYALMIFYQVYSFLSSFN